MVKKQITRKETKQQVKLKTKEEKTQEEIVTLMEAIEHTKLQRSFMERQYEVKKNFQDMIQKNDNLEVLHPKFKYELTREFKQQILDENKMAFESWVLFEYKPQLDQFNSQIEQYEKLLNEKRGEN